MFQEPVRKIGLGRRSITGKRPSIKTGTSHQFESSLERDYLTLLEFSKEVERYVVQPVTIKYLHQDKLRRYTPDMAVYYKLATGKKPLLVEIKYEAELIKNKQLLEPKFSAAREYSENNGFEFTVLTEKQIRTEYLQNIKFLGRYQNTEIDLQYTKKIMTVLDDKKSCTVQELTSNADNQIKAKLLYTVWQLLASQTLSCEMDKAITMNTTVWKNSPCQKLK
jgi:hypothetical protein